MPEMGSHINKCSKCRTDLRGGTYLILGGLRPAHRLCLPCLQKGIERYHAVDVASFAVQYTHDNKPSENMASLKAQMARQLAMIEELQRMLDQATKPES